MEMEDGCGGGCDRCDLVVMVDVPLEDFVPVFMRVGGGTHHQEPLRLEELLDLLRQHCFQSNKNH
jgi:hypothetical protein